MLKLKNCHGGGGGGGGGERKRERERERERKRERERERERERVLGAELNPRNASIINECKSMNIV